jgi:hypothetical protein
MGFRIFRDDAEGCSFLVERYVERFLDYSAFFREERPAHARPYSEKA